MELTASAVPNSECSSTLDLSTVAVIIPALNEAQSLPALLEQLSCFELGQIIVADNGSTDDTAQVATDKAATVISEPIPGYGAACWAGMQALQPTIHTVVFLDADLSDDSSLLPELVRPIQENQADLVIGSRMHQRQPGSMSTPQVFGNWLATTLIRKLWKHHYSDLGPFRAIRREALDNIAMRDRAFGWTVEMQIRAVEEGLRIIEIDVPYHKRVGKSKISGTITGVYKAGRCILTTIFSLWWTRHARQGSTLLPRQEPNNA